MIVAAGRSAARRAASLVEAVPADVLMISARPSPATETGAFHGGLIATDGRAGCRGHQRRVASPAAAPMAVPARTSDG